MTSLTTLNTPLFTKAEVAVAVIQVGLLCFALGVLLATWSFGKLRRRRECEGGDHG